MVPMPVSAIPAIDSAVLATAYWTKVYAWAAIAQALILFVTLAAVFLQLRSLRKSLSLSIYGSTYKSLAQVNDIAFMHADVASAMKWGNPINIFVWRLISHFEFIFNLRQDGYISDEDWEGEYEFIRDCCRRPDFQTTWGQGSTQFNKTFRDFLDSELTKARQST